MFDECVVINLERRPDRLKKFFDSFPDYWPFREPRIIQAIDGERVPKPSFYKQQPGAWGCLRTHLRVYEDAMNKPISQGLFIFEDDIAWDKNAGDAITLFFANLPADWDMVYLGGLHHCLNTLPARPMEGHLGVWRGRAITTTYAYGISARFLPTLYQALLEAPQDHIDQMLASLMSAQPDWKVYCPNPWPVGMDAGHSDICGRHYQRPHFWQPPPPGEPNAKVYLEQTLMRQTTQGDGVWNNAPLSAEEQNPHLQSNVPGWFSPGCGQAYRKYVQMACVTAEAEGRKPFMVEVGCWRGRSISFLHDYIASDRMNLVACDTWQGNSDPLDPTHGLCVFDHFQTNMHQLGILDKIFVLQMPSVEGAAQFEDGSMDLVMIDADHEYSHVKADIEAWWPKLQPGGVLMGHDFQAHNGCPGVVAAVKDFAKRLRRPIAAEADMWIIHKPMPAEPFIKKVLDPCLSP